MMRLFPQQHARTAVQSRLPQDEWLCGRVEVLTVWLLPLLPCTAHRKRPGAPERYGSKLMSLETNTACLLATAFKLGGWTEECPQCYEAKISSPTRWQSAHIRYN